MTGEMANVLVAILAAMLVVAATGDLRSRTIPNWLNLSIALLAIPFWIVSRLPLWPDVVVQVAVALAVFALFAAAFSLGAMGGGDVKLIGAVALWLPFEPLAWMLVVMALLGGALTLLLVAERWWLRAKAPIEIPYGVAIVIPALLALHEPILNRFG